MREKGEMVICPGCFGQSEVVDVAFEGVTVRCIDHGVETTITVEKADELLPWDEAVATEMRDKAEAESHGDISDLGAQMTKMFETLLPAMGSANNPPRVVDVQHGDGGKVTATLTDGSVWRTQLRAKGQPGQVEWECVALPIPRLAKLVNLAVIGVPLVEAKGLVADLDSDATGAKS